MSHGRGVVDAAANCSAGPDSDGSNAATVSPMNFTSVSGGRPSNASRSGLRCAASPRRAVEYSTSSPSQSRARIRDGAWHDRSEAGPDDCSGSSARTRARESLPPRRTCAPQGAATTSQVVSAPRQEWLQGRAPPRIHRATRGPRHAQRCRWRATSTGVGDSGICPTVAGQRCVFRQRSCGPRSLQAQVVVRTAKYIRASACPSVPFGVMHRCASRRR